MMDTMMPDSATTQPPTQGSFVASQATPVSGQFVPFTPDQIRNGLTKVDSASGAPWMLQVAVGASSTPSQQLNTIRLWQQKNGIAQDAKPTGDGNYVFSTNRPGGPMILLRPTQGLAGQATGWEWAHLSDIAGALTQAAGQTRSSLLATEGGPAAMFGAGLLGGAAGEVAGKNTAQLLLQKLFGAAPEDRTASGLLTDMAGQAAGGAQGSAINMGLGGLLQSALASRSGMQPVNGQPSMPESSMPTAQGLAAGSGVPVGNSPAGVNVVPANTGLAQTAARLENFSQQGVTPTLAMASQTPFTKMVESALMADPMVPNSANLPFRGSGLRGAYAQIASQGAAGAEDISEMLARDIPTGEAAARFATAPGMIGSTVRSTGNAAVSDFIRSNIIMTDQLGKMTAEAPPMPPVNTLKTYFQMIADDPELPNSAPLSSNPAFNAVKAIASDAKMQGAISTGQPPQPGAGLTFSQLLALRTKINNTVDAAGGFNADPALMAGIDDLKTLGNGLKQDLYDQAMQIDKTNGFQGNPAQPLGPVTQALADRDAYITAWHDSNGKLAFGTFAKMKEMSADMTAQQLMTTAAQDGGRSLLAIRKWAGNDQYNALSAAWFSGLGQSSETPGTWDPTAFTKNWNAAATYRDNMLVGTDLGASNPVIQSFVQAQSDIAKVMPKWAVTGEKPSIGMRVLAPLVGSTLGGAMAHLAGGTGVSPLAIGTGVGMFGLPWLASKAVTSPLLANSAQALLTSTAFRDVIIPMAKSLAQSTEAGAAITLPMAARIWSVGNTEPRLKAAIGDYMQSLESGGVAVPDLPTTLQRLSTPAATYQPRP
jgi:hypothetical protein